MISPCDVARYLGLGVWGRHTDAPPAPAESPAAPSPGPESVADPVDGCAACDRPRQGHGVRYSALLGHHTFTQPCRDLREDRKRARTAAFWSDA